MAVLFENSVVTNGGKTLFSSWVQGTTLNFDSAAAGTGTVNVAALMAQTALVSQKQTVSILSATAVTGGIKLKLRVTSVGVATAYTLNQFGVWASIDGGPSIMAAIYQDATGIPIPAYSETPDFVYTFYAIIEMSNEGTFNLTVDMSSIVARSDLADVALSGSYNDLDDKPTLSGDVTGHYHSTDRDRANHTGTQIASTISDFAATVRSVVLTGLSLAGAAVISASDTVLSALGKLQAQITAHLGDTDNPHGVTVEQVGASPVSNSATATLSAASWSGASAPYSYAYNNGNITATNPIELLPGEGITAAQLEALQAANIIGGTQSAGSITLLAYGDKPAIDIPVKIIFRGDM